MCPNCSAAESALAEMREERQKDHESLTRIINGQRRALAEAKGLLVKWRDWRGGGDDPFPATRAFLAKAPDAAQTAPAEGPAMTRFLDVMEAHLDTLPEEQQRKVLAPAPAVEGPQTCEKCDRIKRMGLTGTCFDHRPPAQTAEPSERHAFVGHMGAGGDDEAGCTLYGRCHEWIANGARTLCGKPASDPVHAPDPVAAPAKEVE